MMLLLAILALIAVLAARVEAAPAVAPEDEDLLDPEPLLAPEPILDPPPPGTLAPSQVPIPVSAVVAAAYRAADLEGDPAPSWRLRSRLTGLVPMIGVHDGRDVIWKDVSNPTLSNVSVLAVTATWHLDRLVFDPNEMRIAAIEVSRRRQRRRVATIATRTYFQWLRLRAVGARTELRTEELAAELDALTDGWFSEVIAKLP